MVVVGRVCREGSDGGKSSARRRFFQQSILCFSGDILPREVKGLDRGRRQGDVQRRSRAGKASPPSDTGAAPTVGAGDQPANYGEQAYIKTRLRELIERRDGFHGLRPPSNYPVSLCCDMWNSLRAYL
ncbi:protein of unknown function [Candidatus Nitrospira inopinata]|uniref:Uncharacterized protein n=1 Tax=Candidatus Nitrospira inopinata TaxID=1715989 RepID=A0A0S4KU99_9BACT|nr:protein of unknown function [Candidatus Nitrospira inopinata]